MTLTDARIAANDFKAKVRDGFDPIAERKERQRQAEQQREAASDRSFAEIARKYVELYAKPNKTTWRQDELTLENTVIPLWGKRQIDDIQKKDVVELLDQVAKRAKANLIKRKMKAGMSRDEAEAEIRQADGVPGDYAQGRTLDVVRRLFNWCMNQRALIQTTPIGKEMWKNPKRNRKRQFTNDDIRAVWNATEDMFPWKQAMIRMLMLSGQRAGVVRGMKHSEIDLENRLWRVPVEAGRSKNKVEHIVPLTDEMVHIYMSVPRVKGIDHVFWAGGGFQRQKRDIAPNIGTKLKAELREASGLTDFTWQHLRGLATTKMRELRISHEIVDYVQGRFDQSVQEKNYNLYKFLDEKREALQAYENAIMAIIYNNERQNVVALASKSNEE